MDTSIRSWLTAGVATITAAAITFVPYVEEPARAAPPPVVQIAAPPIALAAQVQPAVTATNLPGLLVEWLQRIAVPPSAGQPFPTPQFLPVVGGTSIDSTIKNVYNAVEPWVRYGFEVAAYAVGWVPYVGWLSPQIIILYNFGERIARSITFNVADWLGGNVSFGQGLVNVGVDTVNSFIQLGIDELHFFLPPLPPLPPFPFAATQRTAVTAATQRTAVTAATQRTAVTAATQRTAVTAAAAVDPTTASATPRSTAPVSQKHGAALDEELAAAPAGQAADAATTSKTTSTGGTGPTAKGATGSSSGSSPTSDAGANHHNKGGKKE